MSYRPVSEHHLVVVRKYKERQFPLRIFNKGFKTVIYEVKKIKMYLSNPDNIKKTEQALPELLDPLQREEDVTSFRTYSHHM